jgi:hypothetical protein
MARRTAIILRCSVVRSEEALGCHSDLMRDFIDLIARDANHCLIALNRRSALYPDQEVKRAVRIELLDPYHLRRRALRGQRLASGKGGAYARIGKRASGSVCIRAARCYLYPWWIIPGSNRLSVLNSGDRAQIGPYPPCPLQSFSAVVSLSSALESHTMRLCERMNK